MSPSSSSIFLFLLLCLASTISARFAEYNPAVEQPDHREAVNYDPNDFYVEEVTVMVEKDDNEADEDEPPVRENKTLTIMTLLGGTHRKRVAIDPPVHVNTCTKQQLTLGDNANCFTYWKDDAGLWYSQNCCPCEIAPLWTLSNPNHPQSTLNSMVWNIGSIKSQYRVKVWIMDDNPHLDLVLRSRSALPDGCVNSRTERMELQRRMSGEDFHLRRMLDEESEK